MNDAPPQPLEPLQPLERRRRTVGIAPWVGSHRGKMKDLKRLEGGLPDWRIRLKRWTLCAAVRKFGVWRMAVRLGKGKGGVGLEDWKGCAHQIG